jgi:hypothetical protein
MARVEKFVCLLLGLGLLAACEQKTTTVNPPGEKSESKTTVINKEETPAAKETPGRAAEVESKADVDVNVNASPTP